MRSDSIQPFFSLVAPGATDMLAVAGGIESSRGGDQLDMDTQERQPVYEKPTIVDYGSLQELTAAQTSGAHLDATFPNGTPNDQLTFSTTHA